MNHILISLILLSGAMTNAKPQEPKCSDSSVYRLFNKEQGQVCGKRHGEFKTCRHESFGISGTYSIKFTSNEDDNSEGTFIHCISCEDIEFDKRQDCFLGLAPILGLWTKKKIAVSDSEFLKDSLITYITAFRNDSKAKGNLNIDKAESFRNTFLNTLVSKSYSDPLSRDLGILSTYTDDAQYVFADSLAQVLDPQAIQRLRERFLNSHNNSSGSNSKISAIKRLSDEKYRLLFRWRNSVPDSFSHQTLEAFRARLLDVESETMGFKTLRILDLYVRGYMENFSQQTKVYWNLSVQRSIILLAQAKTVGDIDKIIAEAGTHTESKFISDLLISHSEELKADIAGSAQLIAGLINKNLKDLQTNMIENIAELKRSVEATISHLSPLIPGIKEHSKLALGHFDLLTLNGQALKWRIDDALSHIGSNPTASDAFIVAEGLIGRATTLTLDSFGVINSLEQLNQSVASKKDSALNDFVGKSYELGSVFPEYLFDVLERLNSSISKDQVGFESTIRILRELVKLKMASFNRHLVGLSSKISDKKIELIDRELEKKKPEGRRENTNPRGGNRVRLPQDFPR